MLHQLKKITAFLAVLALAACSNDTGTQLASDPASYPSRPVRIIIPFGPGGLADVTLRLASEEISARLGQPVIVENRPGAGGVAATSTMLNAPADGHTLIVLTNGTTIAESQFADLPYDITTDLQPVSALTWFDLVLLVSPDGGLNSLQDLLDRAHAGTPLRIATINPGSTQHLSAEWFKASAGIDANIITYRTTPDVLGALIRNEVDLVIDAYTALKGAIDGGQAVPVAVTGDSRNPALPEVPTAEEAGVSAYVVTGWNALYIRSETNPEIVARLNSVLQEVAALPELQSRFAELGVIARASTPAAIQERLLEDIQRWHQVMQEAGLLADSQ